MMTRSRKRLCLQALALPENNSPPATGMGNWIELPTEVTIENSKSIS